MEKEKSAMTTNSLYTIEQNGERREFISNNTSLFELLKMMLSEKPYAALMQYGKQISSDNFAEIEQSDKFSFSADINFDEKQVRIYKVDGNVSELDRTYENSSIETYNFDSIKYLVDNIGNEVTSPALREQVLEERLKSISGSQTQKRGGFMNENYNYTKGAACQFNFYVVAFDTQNHYQNYGEMKSDLSFSEARSEFKKAAAENPKHINTMLGIAYQTDRRDLEPHGAGAVDLLQHINGHTHLSDDYAKNPVLMNEGIIKNNIVGILKGDIENERQKPSAEKSKELSGKSSPSSLIGKLRQNEEMLRNQNEVSKTMENQRDL